MSIVAYIGRPGSGKSYGVVENVIIPALEKSRHVVTNIPLNHEALAVKFDAYNVTQFGADALQQEDFWKGIPAGAIVCLDEVWRAFPAGMTQDKIPVERREFLAEHRHMVSEDGWSTEIVLVTQDLKQIAASVRPLIDKLYIAEKLDQVGAASRYRVDIYQGYELKTDRFIRSVYGRYKPEVFKFYQSHTKSQAGAVAGIEERPDKRANLLLNKWIILGMPLAVVMILGGSISGYRMYARYTAPLHESKDVGPVMPNGEVLDVKPKQQDKPVAIAKEKVPTVEKEPIKESKRWRLQGIFHDGMQTTAMLVGYRGFKRKVQAAECDREADPVCVVDGEQVARWTGPPPAIGTSSMASVGTIPESGAGQAKETVKSSSSRDVSR